MLLLNVTLAIEQSLFAKLASDGDQLGELCWFYFAMIIFATCDNCQCPRLSQCDASSAAQRIVGQHS